MATRSHIATPWGRSTLVDRVSLAQSAGDKRFKSIVELLETERGEQLIRFAYSTDGIARRGPVTLRLKDLGRLRTAIERSPAISEVLGLGGDA